jgi:hypothetical protein
MCREEDEKHTKQNDIRIFEKKNVKQKSTRRPKIPTVHLFWDGATWWTGDSHWPFILKSTQFFFFFFSNKKSPKKKRKKRNFWHFNFRRKKKCYRSCHHINSMTLSDCSSQDAKRKKKLLEKKIRILQINQINFASTEFLIQWPVRRCESRMESSPRKRKKKKKKNAIV